MSEHYPRMTTEASLSPSDPKSQLNQCCKDISAPLFDLPFNIFFIWQNVKSMKTVFSVAISCWIQWEKSGNGFQYNTLRLRVFC